AQGETQGEAQGEAQGKGQGEAQGENHGKGQEAGQEGNKPPIKEEPVDDAGGFHSDPGVRSTTENGGEKDPVDLTDEMDELTIDPEYGQALYRKPGAKIKKGVPITTVGWIGGRAIKYLNRYGPKSHLKYQLKLYAVNPKYKENLLEK
ncbi:hypothetical protein AOQ84DRAFT_381810, partial [Glonium stellatum]